MEAGSPIVPALAGPGYVRSLWHPSQAAQILGLPEPDGGDPTRVAWDINAILEVWLECIAPVPWERLNEATLARGRSPRELTLNAFRPIELLAAAWSEGTYNWNGSEDSKWLPGLSSLESLIGYAKPIQEGWAIFIGESASALAHDRIIASRNGEISYRTLLDSQRLHAAFHLRQVLDFLESKDVRPAARPDFDRMAGLSLPAAIY